VRAAVLEAPRSRLVVQELTPTEIGPREVLVRVGASGLCHTDLSIMQAAEPSLRLPIVMGHEGAGVVEEVGREVETLQKGDRVIASWIAACGRCFWCIRGQAHLCSSLNLSGARAPWRLDDGREASALTGIGTLAEAMLGSEFSFVKIETDLMDEHLALIGCGVTTGVCAALNAAPVTPGSSVAVFGCGGVGISAIQGARIAGGATIIAIDPVPLKREMAMKLGATHTVDPGAVDPVERIKELTGGRGADITLETAGSNDAATWAVLAARRGGTAVCIGGGSPDVSSLSTIDAKTVKWSLYGHADPRREFPKLVSMIEHGTLDLDSLVSRRITLDEVNDGFDAMERGEVIRSVVLN
jgi:S-(hydroxymethyl)glutathione dehydrogenase/alcohol dehydrogenase